VAGAIVVLVWILCDEINHSAKSGALRNGMARPSALENPNNGLKLFGDEDLQRGGEDILSVGMKNPGVASFLCLGFGVVNFAYACEIPGECRSSNIPNMYKCYVQGRKLAEPGGKCSQYRWFIFLRDCLTGWIGDLKVRRLVLSVNNLR